MKNTNFIATDQPSLGTYDSFCKLPAGSNHSTPAKLSPCQEGDQTTVTMKRNNSPLFIYLL